MDLQIYMDLSYTDPQTMVLKNHQSNKKFGKRPEFPKTPPSKCAKKKPAKKKTTSRTTRPSKSIAQIGEEV